MENLVVSYYGGDVSVAHVRIRKFFASHMGYTGDGSLEHISQRD